jgi:hypothetical protein
VCASVLSADKEFVEDARGTGSMIVCSCLGITDKDIERALVEVLSRPDAPLPTPGIIYRQMKKKMV